MDENTELDLPTPPFQISRRTVIKLAGTATVLGIIGDGFGLRPSRAAAAAAAAVIYQHPLAPSWKMTQTWGRLEPSGRHHAGTDYVYIDRANAGAPIYCVADGTVRVARTTRDTNWGYYVIIEHADGVFSFYAHMIVASGLVVGTPIARGQQVSTIGNWVNGAPGAYHLHLGMWVCCTSR